MESSHGGLCVSFRVGGKASGVPTEGASLAGQLPSALRIHCQFPWYLEMAPSTLPWIRF